ncbi:MAG: CDP-alcohol phosphatidyltransferase family protein [bacterium]|nr:CDP-alcohol phosphatidyltransferase family protein [bacterium]
MNTASPEDQDFRQLGESNLSAGTSRAIGQGFIATRYALGGRLVRLGVTPNHITVAGFIASCGAAVCLVMGAGHHSPAELAVSGVSRSFWPLLAAGGILLAGSCDVLDGAVARMGNLGTDFGGLLDSVLDRLSEIVVYVGIVIHFAVIGNATYAALAVIALCNGLMIAYTKSRAEDSIEHCGVGFWQRGERSAAMLFAGMSCHVPTVLWQQAISPFFTFLLRMHHARATMRANRTGAAPPARSGFSLLQPWRYPRGSIPYDVTVAVNIAFIVVMPWIHPWFYGAGDPLGDWLASLTKAS